jgi:ribosomal protein L20A (L18A)
MTERDDEAPKVHVYPPDGEDEQHEEEPEPVYRDTGDRHRVKRGADAEDQS